MLYALVKKFPLACYWCESVDADCISKPMKIMFELFLCLSECSHSDGSECLVCEWNAHQAHEKLHFALSCVFQVSHKL